MSARLQARDLPQSWSNNVRSATDESYFDSSLKSKKRRRPQCHLMIVHVERRTGSPSSTANLSCLGSNSGVANTGLIRLSTLHNWSRLFALYLSGH